MLLGRLNETCTSFSTTLAALNDTSISPELAQRQWYWQSCLQWGFFQVAPNASLPGQPAPLRSARIDLAYHLDLCRQAFSGWDMRPATEATNARYGGLDVVGSRVYFASGSLDPWKALSLTTDRSCCASLVTRTINGTSHCGDLYGASPADPPDLTAARIDIRAHVARWVSPANTDLECPLFFESCPADSGATADQGDTMCTDTQNDVMHCGSCSPAVPVDSRNASSFYCRGGQLYPLSSGVTPAAGEDVGLLGARQILVLGLVFLSLGFVSLAMGMHALRKVAVLRDLHTMENMDRIRAHIQRERAASPTGGASASPVAAAAAATTATSNNGSSSSSNGNSNNNVNLLSGHSAPGGRVPLSPSSSSRSASAHQGWNSNPATQPLTRSEW